MNGGSFYIIAGRRTGRISLKLKKQTSCSTMRLYWIPTSLFPGFAIAFSHIRDDVRGFFFK